VGENAGLREAQVLDRIGEWLADGVIRRFGVIVRHHELGFAANAMAVWDVPDERVSDYGAALAGEAGVTLCYRRLRAEPHWPYNLFCMVHGRDRTAVQAQIADIARTTGLSVFPHALLFSTRRFKQRGARYGMDSSQSTESVELGRPTTVGRRAA
jgi:DNA-binding Lrp family transcriptional regulator